MLAAGGHKGNLGLGDGDSLLLHSTFYIFTFPIWQRSRHMHAIAKAKGNIHVPANAWIHRENKIIEKNTLISHFK